MVGLMTMTWAWAETTLALTIGVISTNTLGRSKAVPKHRYL